MVGIGNLLTPGRIAFALGAVATGAAAGGLIADHNDGDVTKGALIGGASALAGLALLVGGAAAWQRFAGTRSVALTAAASGANELALASTTAASATASARPLLSPSLSDTIRATADRLLRQATEAVHLQPLAVSVPGIAATPRLPVSVAPTSGATFLNTLGNFLR